MTSILLRGGAALGLLLAATVAPAQDPFPSRTIRWFVPFLAGTAPDTTVRIVADAMAAELKQTVVIENKPGVAGNLGAQAAARSAPDGYTWVYSSAPMAAAMRMHRKPGFDVMKDFTHIGRIANSDLTVVAQTDAGNARHFRMRRKRAGGLDETAIWIERIQGVAPAGCAAASDPVHAGSGRSKRSRARSKPGLRMRTRRRSSRCLGMPAAGGVRRRSG